MRSEKKQHDESDGVHRRVLAADSLCFFLAAQARKLSVLASLEWAEEALKRTGQRRRCSYRSVEFFLGVWVDRLVLAALGRSSWWKHCACDRYVFFWGATAGVRCAVVCIRGRGCCPGRHPLRFTICRLVWGRR